MLEQDPVEERLVARVQRLEPDVLVERIGHAAQILQDASDLLLLGCDERGQESAQPEGVALGVRERSALVQCRIAQQVDAARDRRPCRRVYWRTWLFSFAAVLLARTTPNQTYSLVYDLSAFM